MTKVEEFLSTLKDYSFFQLPVTQDKKESKPLILEDNWRNIEFAVGILSRSLGRHYEILGQNPPSAEEILERIQKQNKKTGERY